VKISVEFLGAFAKHLWSVLYSFDASVRPSVYISIRVEHLDC